MIAARDNPFRSACVESLAFHYATDDLHAILTRLEGIGRRGILVGAEGTGKTTLLETLARHSAQQGRSVVWLRLRRDPLENQERLDQFFATTVAGSLVCIDGLEQLGWWMWRRVQRHSAEAAYVIATSHRPGRLPILRRHETSPQMLAQLIHELACESTVDAEVLWRRHRGNVRLCLRDLYDHQARSLSGIDNTASLVSNGTSGVGETAT